jgi:DNA-binding MarR family transcriptional regulator
MNNDVAVLQEISDTLQKQPMASQRILAENTGMSIGLMNAVLKRFVERGWIMLSNVNMRKLSYAVTPAGIAELAARSQTFAKRTFALANDYNQIICSLIEDSVKSGKNEVILYGQSYIKFLLAYACQTLNVKFSEKKVNDAPVSDALCFAGELNDEEDNERLVKEGCVNLLDLLNK